MRIDSTGSYDTYLVFRLHQGILGRLVELLEGINLYGTALPTSNIV